MGLSERRALWILPLEPLPLRPLPAMSWLDHTYIHIHIQAHSIDVMAVLHLYPYIVYKGT